MPASLKSPAVVTICCALLTSKSGKADGIGLVLAERLDQLIGGHLDPEVDHVVAVVAEDDLDQILADVVDVALDRGQHDLAARLDSAFSMKPSR